MIRILLVEDNAIVLGIMSDMVMMQDDFEVIGTAQNGIAALELIERGLQPDIVLADINMQGMGGIELTKTITDSYSNLKVIIITMHDKPTYLKQALGAGAKGFLLKDGDMEALFSAVRKVNAGEMFISNLSVE